MSQRNPLGDEMRIKALAVFLIGGVVFLAGAAPDTQPATVPATQASASLEAEQGLPHVHIDRVRRVIDLDAHVVLREAKWLELLACTPNTRDYESILTIDARPSHIHLALLLLGLEPGAPMTWKRQDAKVQILPPHGPRISVTLIYTKDGKKTQIMPGQWVINQKNNTPLPDNIWLFAGSKMIQQGDRRFYLADLNGSAIALVNFGDDLLTRPGIMTNQDDDQTWGTNTKAIPAVGTAVTIRLHPLDAVAPAKAADR